MNASRRRFLQRVAALGAYVAPTALPLSLGLLASGGASSEAANYKALVCLFLGGGNDAFNTLVPTDVTSRLAYTTYRGTQPAPIALLAPGLAADPGAAPGTPAALGGVIPLTPTFAPGDPNASRGLAVHPALGDVARLFDAGRLAMVPNVGPLIEPLTLEQYLAKAKRVPARLFSHNDQVSTWLALAPDGARTGWGGGLADRIAGLNESTVFTSISVAGQAVFLSGESTFQYQVSTRGGVSVRALGSPLFGSAAASEQARQLLALEGEHLMAREYARTVRRSIDAQVRFQSAFDASVALSPQDYVSPVTGRRQRNPLAEQLQAVARIIGAQASLGVRRQLFYVALGGFDTHDDQNQRHAELMGRLSHAMGYFDAAIQAKGQRDAVTLFTASDFGRAFSTNGDGTDHGWGGHHMVLGGAQVRGGQVHGRYPDVGLGHANDVWSGALLPDASVEQFGSTLGRWFGLSDSDQSRVFPNLGNFASRDLGFMRTD